MPNSDRKAVPFRQSAPRSLLPLDGQEQWKWREHEKKKEKRTRPCGRVQRSPALSPWGGPINDAGSKRLWANWLSMSNDKPGHCLNRRHSAPCDGRRWTTMGPGNNLWLCKARFSLLEALEKEMQVHLRCLVDACQSWQPAAEPGREKPSPHGVNKDLSRGSITSSASQASRGHLSVSSGAVHL